MRGIGGEHALGRLLAAHVERGAEARIGWSAGAASMSCAGNLVLDGAVRRVAHEPDDLDVERLAGLESEPLADGVGTETETLRERSR